jgi:transposase
VTEPAPPDVEAAPEGDSPAEAEADPAEAEARAELRRLARQAPGRLARRAQAVLWWLEGQSQAAVSRRLGVSRQSVQAWCARFRAEGPAGLPDRPRSGRPPRAGPAALTRLTACLAGSDVPGTRGPGGWTVPRLVAALAAAGVGLSARTVRRLLRRLDARWRRGRLVAKGDPDRAAALRRLADGLLAAALAGQRAGRRLVIVFADEADLALLPHAGYSWQLPDRPATVPTPGQNRKVGLFGALSLDGDLIVTEAPRKTAAALTGHLAAVAARFPGAEVAVIWDNVGIHHAKATRAWLSEHPWVHPLFLPRYSPNDNAQERVWGWLRAAVCRNRAYPDLAAKRAEARAFLAERRPAELCRRCVPVPLLTGLLAEAFAPAGDPAPAVPLHPAPPVNKLLAA